MFKNSLAIEMDKYLEKLEIEEEYAERFAPITFDEELEFLLRRRLVIPILAMKDVIIRNFDIEKWK